MITLKTSHIFFLYFFTPYKKKKDCKNKNFSHTLHDKKTLSKTAVLLLVIAHKAAANDK